MTDRILDPDGKYAPPAPEVQIDKGVDPATLPHVKPDPWLDVVHDDFSDEASLSRVQQLSLAQLAESRGDMDSSMRWKQAAHATNVRETRQAQAETMKGILNPQHAPMSSAPIVQATSDLPWENDETYVQIRDDLAAARAKLDHLHAGTSEHIETGRDVVNLTTALSDRQDAVRQEAIDAGIVSEMDLRSLAAQQGLADKMGAVEAMFTGGAG